MIYKHFLTAVALFLSSSALAQEIDLGSSVDNVFVKPNEQSEACFDYAVARKRRMKSNVFVKPDEQSEACFDYAVARKRRMKSNYFECPKTEEAYTDDDGFVRRWMLLEPIGKPNRDNTVFTDSYLREHLRHEYFKGQFSVIPKDGQKVKTRRQRLEWHAVDSKLYNVKLFRFATGLQKQYYGVIFWAVTVIECDEDIPDVRISVGSNSASMWWLNGEETLMLSGDRRMVADDMMSQRVTLRKGRNVLRGAVINGPGMSDFCVRFINEKGEPLRLKVRI